MRLIDGNACESYFYEHLDDNAMAGALNAISEMPTIEPEPYEGYWKKDEKDDCPPVFRQFRICSVCGAIETSETNYCPDCGAKMRGD